MVLNSYYFEKKEGQNMISEKMMELGKTRSVIREIFEYGNKRKQEIGADKVFDFSLGNPSVPAPDSVNQAICDILKEEPSTVLHGYTSAQGDFEVRKTIAEYINKTQSTNVSADDIYVPKMAYPESTTPIIKCRITLWTIYNDITYFCSVFIIFCSQWNTRIK